AILFAFFLKLNPRERLENKKGGSRVGFVEFALFGLEVKALRRIMEKGGRRKG
ncbi:hypothetical protein NQZ68_013345, partial [Dissostichus eleginoides]